MSVFALVVAALSLGGCSGPDSDSGGPADTCDADEVPYDGVDNDCDAATPDDDLDGDGLAHADDCDDTDAGIGGAEVPYDGADNDCDPATPDDDLDGDGLAQAGDCDDTDAAIGGDEAPYDGFDNDCDPTTLDDDLDGDGHVLVDDCDDADPLVGGAEIPGDGVDNDCDPATLDDPIAILGPPDGTAAPHGITLGVTCTAGLPITLTGDFTTSPATIGCSPGGEAVATLPFSAGDGKKMVEVEQGGTSTSRAFVRDSTTGLHTFAAVPDTANACGTNVVTPHPLDRHNVIITSDGGTPIQVSTDGSATLAPPTGSPFPSGSQVRAWPDPYASQVWYLDVLSDNSGSKLTGGIYRSDDGGETWTLTGKLPDGLEMTNYPNAFTADRLSFDMAHRMYVGHPGGFATSDDDGATWDIKLSKEITSELVTHVTPLPDSSVIWIGTDDLGVFVSTDGGDTMTPDPALAELLPPYDPGLMFLQESGVLVSPYDPDHLVAAAGWADSKVMRSTDGGATWDDMGAAMEAVGITGIAYLSGASLAFEPGDSDTFWIQNYIRDQSGQGMIHTTDGGASFTNVDNTYNIYSTVVGRAVNDDGVEILFRSNNCQQVDREQISIF